MRPAPGWSDHVLVSSIKTSTGTTLVPENTSLSFHVSKILGDHPYDHDDDDDGNDEYDEYDEYDEDDEDKRNVCILVPRKHLFYCLQDRYDSMIPVELAAADLQSYPQDQSNEEDARLIFHTVLRHNGSRTRIDGRCLDTMLDTIRLHSLEPEGGPLQLEMLSVAVDCFYDVFATRPNPPTMQCDLALSIARIADRSFPQANDHPIDWATQ